MRFPADVEAIAKTVLYEGYALYPYRASSLKNARRLMFGSLAPGQEQRVSVLLKNSEQIVARLRFLHAAQTDDWSAVERDVEVNGCGQVEFVFGGICGSIELKKIDKTILITTKNSAASTETMESTQTLLHSEGGVFSSGVVCDEDDDDVDLQGLVCAGAYPVFVGPKGSRDTVLLAPFVLADWPSVARESKGDAFDATENDALLGLSIQALSDDEKRQMAALDPRTAALLERASDVEGLLEGTWRERPFKAGDRVILRPKERADVMDLALDGKDATVVSVDVDVDERVFVSVTVDDDPGADLGLQGHRFFFFAHEVERR